jgi:membrane-bound serine protease (ClpP class)
MSAVPIRPYESEKSMNDLRTNFGSRVGIQNWKFLLAAVWLLFPIFYLGISLGQSQPQNSPQIDNAGFTPSPGNTEEKEMVRILRKRSDPDSKTNLVWRQGKPDTSTAVIIKINPSLSSTGLTVVTRQIDEALDKNCQTIVFEFSDRGLSFDGFRDLAQKIIDLSRNKNIRTVAYIPKEAKQMNMLAVYACRDIVANELAQLGQVIPPMRLPDPSVPRINYDEQSVLNLIEELARLTNRNPILARAMTQRSTTLTEIRRQGNTESELVDQAGMSELSKPGSPPWEKVRTWVDSGSVLLLTGSQARELKLVTDFASSRENLAKILGVTLLELDTAQKSAAKDDPNQPAFKDRPDPTAGKPPKAVIITIADMVDPGLFESLKRRTETALEQGATIIIYKMDTFGGRVDSAIEIYDYFLKDVSRRARTVAYIPTKAISAGAMISVACHDIIMKRNSHIGDCAPIQMGGSMEGVEREKIETVLRSYFRDAARENGYPVALCEAMVSAHLEVLRVKNVEDGTYQYFERLKMPKGYPWDVQNAEIVCPKDQILTLNDEDAVIHKISRATVEGTETQALEQLLTVLEQRYEVKIPRPVVELQTNWSEELVRWLTSPAVSGILLMVALLAIYVELNSPGLGLPGAVAVIALVILFGSKFLIGMANWWEIAVFVIGLGLLIMEIFVIPGFGIAGISGVILILFSLVAMMVSNPPGDLPVPSAPFEKEMFEKQILWTMAGFVFFVVIAYFIGRYFHRMPVTNRLVLETPTDSPATRSGGKPAPAPAPPVSVGQTGTALSSLRPSGNAKFGAFRLTVVTRGEMVEAKQQIKVVAIDGNSIVVKGIPPSNDA